MAPVRLVKAAKMVRAKQRLVRPMYKAAFARIPKKNVGPGTVCQLSAALHILMAIVQIARLIVMKAPV